MYITEIVSVVDFMEYRGGLMKNSSRLWHGLILNIGQMSIFTVSGEEHRFRSGDILFLPRSLSYSFSHPDKIAKCLVVDFFGEDVGDWFLVRDCGDLRGKFEEACRTWEKRSDDASRLSCMAQVYALIAEAVSRRDQNSTVSHENSRRRITPVLEYIHENFASPGLRVPELAGIAGMSARHLNNLFSEAVGMPPKAYIESLRLKYADELLAGGFSVTDTARMAGYSDAYHFSKIYKSKRGITPSERRKK